MRAFVAVAVSRQAKESVAGIRRAWSPSLPAARWVAPDNLHLTLRFLGELDPRRTPALADSLGDAATQTSRFTYSLRGGGCFPSPERARVLWVGVDPVPGELVRLQRAVEGAVQHHGFAAEGREFHPHLTIARLKTPAGAVARMVAELEGQDFGDTTVFELVLFESRLSPRGASYHPLGRFRLEGP